LSITNDGNVGIGTTSPTDKLEVAGKTKIYGDFEVETKDVTIKSIGQEIQLISKQFDTKIIITSSGITIEAFASIDINAINGNLNLNGSNVNINADNFVNISGTVINLNGVQGGGMPAARVADSVFMPAAGDGKISTGSFSVFIGN